MFTEQLTCQEPLGSPPLIVLTTLHVKNHVLPLLHNPPPPSAKAKREEGVCQMLADNFSVRLEMISIFFSL